MICTSLLTYQYFSFSRRTLVLPRRVLNLPYPTNAPITRSSGVSGRSGGSPMFVNQSRKKLHPCFLELTASRLFQKAPCIAYTSRYFPLPQTLLTFLRSAAGLIFIVRGLQLAPLSYYFYNYRGTVPTFGTVYSTKQLLFIKVGSRLTNIRDVFLTAILFAAAPGSFATLSFFDRWSGFLTVLLPSGQSRLFFFLSRSEIYNRNWKKKPLTGSNLCLDFTQINRNKAGTFALCGRRPKVRGVAKNPVDHPHGGRTKAIRFQRTPWGKPAKLK